MLVNGRASSSVTRQLASSSPSARGRRAFQAAPSLKLRSARTFAVAAEAPLLALKDAPLQPVMEKGELQLHKMTMAGIYAVYAYTAMPPSIQYIGLSRKIDASVSSHLQELPDLTHAVKCLPMEDTSREALVAAWKQWIEEAVEETGSVPPGNLPGETKWQARKASPLKREIRLTAGKAISGITIEQLVDQVVKTNKVVAFVKGTRTQPQCGFSLKMLTILNESRADYEVVNVLDDVHNPGLRDAIKTYSQWPTIPQLYVSGEFIGGADIVEQMNASGELRKLVAPTK